MTEHTIESQETSQAWLYVVWVIVLAYLALNAFTQHIASPTAELDQSEQLVLSQKLQWGYGSQPPLYTWLVWGAFSVSGPSLATLSIIKVLILSVLIGTLIGTGKEFGFTKQQYIIMLAGVVLIPQIIWESQRDLTHSTLATMLAGTTLLQVLRLKRSPTNLNYALLGLCTGMGLLSKYNYFLFLAGLLSAVAWTPTYRTVVSRYRLLLTLAVAVAIVSPHAIWALGNVDVAMASYHRFRTVMGIPLQGLGQLLAAVFAFATPLWVLAVFLIRRNSPLPDRQATARLFLSHLCMTIIAIATLLVLASGTNRIKNRWLQPMLFFLPLLLALYSTSIRSRVRTFSVMGITTAIIVAFALPMRSVIARHLKHPQRSNIPFKALATEMQPLIGSPSVIIAENRMLGGNLRLAFPKVVVITPDAPIRIQIPNSKRVVVCETVNCQNDAFRTWLKKLFDLELTDFLFNHLAQPFYYQRDSRYVLYWTMISQK